MDFQVGRGRGRGRGRIERHLDEQTSERLRGELKSVRKVVLVVGASEAETTLAEGFEGLGCNVECAIGARAASESVRARHPDLMVLEWSLADGSGLDLIAEIRGISPMTRTIVVTARASISAALASIRAGARDYMTKPVTALEIVASLDGTGTPVSEAEHWPTLQHARREYIRNVLAECGSVSKTARVLNLDRTSLRRMMVRFGLSTERASAPRASAPARARRAAG